MLSISCLSSDLLDRVNLIYGLSLNLETPLSSVTNQSNPIIEYVQGDLEDGTVLNSLANKGPFDVILLEDTLGYLDDIQTFLDKLRILCSPETRVVSVYYGYLWEPLLNLSENLGLRMRSFDTTWLRMGDVENFFVLSGFETIKKEWQILCPFRLLGIGDFINRYIGPLPLIRKLCVRHYLVARAMPESRVLPRSVSVVIPCRNEKGNIESVITRLPDLGCHVEIIFVEGHSSDGTWEEVERVIAKYTDLDIKLLHQPGSGKGDAVRAGFDRAKGDVLMILDADLTVPPEDLPKFMHAIVDGQGEYINGSRLIYGMEDQAMRFLNYLANHLFAHIFTYLVNQRLTDTLCGTKVINRKDYEKIVANRNYFGDFDPFGDFDLIFGASKLNLKFVEVPIRYARRKYGVTQISRFRHGFLLLKMVLFAYRKLKSI